MHHIFRPAAVPMKTSGWDVDQGKYSWLHAAHAYICAVEHTFGAASWAKLTTLDWPVMVAAQLRRHS